MSNDFSGVLDEVFIELRGPDGEVKHTDGPDSARPQDTTASQETCK
jgi:hypothetical protein